MALPMPRSLTHHLTVSSTSTSSHVRRLPSRQISSRCRPLLRPSWVISAAAAAPPPDSSGSSSARPRFNPFKRSGKKEVGLHPGVPCCKEQTQCQMMLHSWMSITFLERPMLVIWWRMQPPCAGFESPFAAKASRHGFPPQPRDGDASTIGPAVWDSSNAVSYVTDQAAAGDFAPMSRRKRGGCCKTCSRTNRTCWRRMTAAGDQAAKAAKAAGVLQSSHTVFSGIRLSQHASDPAQLSLYVVCSVCPR